MLIFKSSNIENDSLSMVLVLCFLSGFYILFMPHLIGMDFIVIRSDSLVRVLCVKGMRHCSKIHNQFHRYI